MFNLRFMFREIETSFAVSLGGDYMANFSPG